MGQETCRVVAADFRRARAFRGRAVIIGRRERDRRKAVFEIRADRAGENRKDILIRRFQAEIIAMPEQIRAQIERRPRTIRRHPAQVRFHDIVAGGQKHLLRHFGHE